ncbi:MAG: TetR/AcrR family transcriptional regulator [Dehalococcoidia bacterium]
MDAAIRLFNAKGYKATTTAVIAEEVGVYEPTLYKHFENKKQLFIECFKDIIGELLDQYKEARKKYKDDEVGYLLEVSHIYIRYIMQNPHKSKFIVHLLGYKDDADIERVFNRFMKDSVKNIEEVIDSAKKKGTIDSDVESNLLAGMFVTQYFTVVALKELIKPNNFKEEKMMKMTLNLLRIKEK